MKGENQEALSSVILKIISNREPTAKKDIDSDCTGQGVVLAGDRKHGYQAASRGRVKSGTLKNLENEKFQLLKGKEAGFLEARCWKTMK